MNRPIGISLVAVLFWCYAIYFLQSGIVILIHFGIKPLLSSEPINFQIFFIVSEIAIGLLSIAVTVYFGRIGLRLFRVDESVRIPAIRSLFGVLLFCSLGVLIFYNATARRELEIGFDYSLLPIAGLAIAGLSYLLISGKKHFNQIEIGQPEHQPLA